MLGVPVDASVAAILRPMSPDFPTPRTTTRPLHCVISLIASAYRLLTPRICARTVSASRRITSRIRFKSAESGDGYLPCNQGVTSGGSCRTNGFRSDLVIKKRTITMT